MTSELLLKLEEQRKSNILVPPPDQKKEPEIIEKSKLKHKRNGNEGKRKPASQDVFSAHDFDIDIDVAEMTVRKTNILIKP